MDGGRLLSATPVPTIDGFSDLVYIGRGGFSTVYSAVQAGIERRVAIKVLDLGASDLRRFERECRTLGALSGVHGIVPVLQAAYTSAGQPCIVMQLMDGGSLAYRVRMTGPLSPHDVVENGVVLATALQAAHDARVYHRDIKPENVLFHGNQAAIADFGIALVEDMESRSQTTDSISPPHAPPERFVDGRSDPVLGDVYSLGSTLYAALAGRPPFGTTADGGVAGLIQRVTLESLPPIDRVDLPAALWQALVTATAKEPLDRFQSMASFARALRSVDAATNELGDSTVHRAPPNPTVIRTAPLPAASPAFPPHHVAPPQPPPALPQMPVTYQQVWTGEMPFMTGPPPKQRASTVLWVAAGLMLALSLGGLAFVLGRGLGSEVGTSTTTTVQVSTTESTTGTTETSETTETTETTPTTERTLPSTTSKPTTVPTTSLPVSEATTAVDRYLAAASGFDTEVFVRQWAYPIDSHYGTEGVSEHDLRQSAESYWASNAVLEFERTGPTEVVASARGWDTATEYEAHVIPTEGSAVCLRARIHLGFNHDWKLRTANETFLENC